MFRLVVTIIWVIFMGVYTVACCLNVTAYQNVYFGEILTCLGSINAFETHTTVCTVRTKGLIILIYMVAKNN